MTAVESEAATHEFEPDAHLVTDRCRFLMRGNAFCWQVADHPVHRTPSPGAGRTGGDVTAEVRCPDCGAETVLDGPFGDRVCPECGAYAGTDEDGVRWTPVVTIQTRGRT